MPTIKEDIKSLLDELKKKGKDRRTIEKELGYSENYLDYASSRGASEKVLALLRDYKEKLELGLSDAPLRALNIATSQQETIELLTRQLNKALQRIEELETKISEHEKGKQNRRSA